MDDPAGFIGSAISTAILIFIAFKKKKESRKMTFRELNESPLVQMFRRKNAREAKKSPMQRLESGEYYFETRGALSPDQEQVFLGILFAWLNANERTSVEFRNQTADLNASFDNREGHPIDLFKAAGGILRVSLLNLPNVNFIGFLFTDYLNEFVRKANETQERLLEPSWSNYDYFCPLFEAKWQEWLEFQAHRNRP